MASLKAPTATKKKLRIKKRTRLAVAPHLAHAVVDDVRHGEDQQSAGQVDAKHINLFGLKNIGRDEASAEKHAEHHEQHAHFSFQIVHFLVF